MITGVWREVAWLRIAARAGPYARHFARHLVCHPYREQPRGTQVRVRAAVYDAVLNLLLDGYAELAGHPLRPETGRLVVRLNRLLAAFDDRYEYRRSAGASLAFDEVLADQPVRERVGALADFLKRHPEGPAIREYLMGRIAGQYDRYVALTSAPGATVDLDRQLEVAALDSAGFGRCFADSVGLFHRQPPTATVLDQFAGVGMVAKFADDLLDFWDDLAADEINLLRGVLRRHPAEERAVAGVVLAAAPRRTGIAWWRAHCPLAYADYSALVREQRDRLTSARLRLAGDLMLVPVRRGRTLLRSAPVGLRI